MYSTLCTLISTYFSWSGAASLVRTCTCVLNKNACQRVSFSRFCLEKQPTTSMEHDLRSRKSYLQYLDDKELLQIQIHVQDTLHMPSIAPTHIYHHVTRCTFSRVPSVFRAWFLLGGRYLCAYDGCACSYAQISIRDQHEKLKHEGKCLRFYFCMYTLRMRVDNVTVLYRNWCK